MDDRTIADFHAFTSQARFAQGLFFVGFGLRAIRGIRGYFYSEENNTTSLRKCPSKSGQRTELEGGQGEGLSAISAARFGPPPLDDGLKASGLGTSLRSE